VDLAAHDIALIRAANPSPLTLEGTNTWIVGREPAYVVDPGPLLDDHLEAIIAETDRRGGIAGIALTHDHGDHAEAVGALRARTFNPAVGAASADADVRLGDGSVFGPFTAVAAPGHADDHLVLVAGRAAFTGDAVLGTGSVFVTSRLGEYLDALRRLRAMPLEVLCPGHGPPVWEPARKLDEYVGHRLDRERALQEALAAGLRGEDELLAAAWPDAPSALRPVAMLTMRAHLQKLADEGRLPVGAPDGR
jgi:glyoxylase-like metal-dependent hydrolase (beta-lactamase superfamily II)